MNKFLLSLTFIILSSCSTIEVNAIQLPSDATQRLFSLNINTTSQTLFNAYMNSDVNQRRLAEMYITGVLDSTEGVAWCGYKLASPNAIQEQVFISLKDTANKFPKLRASEAIIFNLNRLLPCKEQK